MFPFPFHVFLYLYQYGLSTRLCLPFHVTLSSFDSSTRLESRYSCTLSPLTRYNYLYLYLLTEYICDWG